MRQHVGQTWCWQQPETSTTGCISEADVTVLQDFTMPHAENFVRYNIQDWLSVGDTDEDDEDAYDAG
ncbi:hypothetical protein LZV00_20960 [Pseudomonas kielensis]|uniref:hypothetical protein n=1 Tax=Pseudomonas kielensis TaxID=2762577 RepID=UPI0022408F06|nr:hypothetical protein [Pseudomonas kielensis]UZM13122.1 hypothetical protein LZV00_20960 [Pseudomonas kielensis]